MGQGHLVVPDAFGGGEGKEEGGPEAWPGEAGFGELYQTSRGSTGWAAAAVWEGPLGPRTGYEFPGVAIPTLHKLGGLNQQKLILSEFWGLEI